ncbi:lysoplasmalogenase [Chitinophaga sp. Cy-1792]|uniref:lysoplasmalogenase n=1 Tax=Chitinophaga sp. Cy-1792 TaxID=2608339 RepID=UPI00141FC325|nr:lysoplasmalogenase [Chitinophaga sp. Cy-1792]NIG52202.1 lysoplasmalogenase [Chitinophaga sp. Cy-1792]
MLKSRWLILFLIVLVADVVFTGLHLETYRYVSKPLLTIILAIYAVSEGHNIRGSFRAFLLLALLFSFGGDVLLMFDHVNPLYFMLGLGSFLLAHVMYITFFLKIRYSNLPAPYCKYPFIFLHAAFLIWFILFLFPYLGALRIPVIIYALTISITVQSVLHAFHFKWQPEGWYCITGAVLFMISDSLIAVGKFYHPLPANGVWVMLTYGLAQLGLVYGAVKFFAAHRR